MAKKDEVTPMMKQFYDFKSKHPDALLLFRCGDFYETYADDAVIASEILGITLTKRSGGAGKKKMLRLWLVFHIMHLTLICPSL